MIPHCRAPAWPADIASSRFAATIRTDDPSGCQIAILGLPDDTGVRLNNGRTGARHGPEALRHALARLGVRHPSGFAYPSVFDAGDVIPTDDLHETHERVRAATCAILDLGLFPIAIGGGHDLTFPFVHAVSMHLGCALAGVYFDAHLDVRESVGSGMPFRRLIETGAVRELHVHGLDPFSNTDDHVRWFRQHAGSIDSFRPNDLWPAGDLFVSLDLDVIDQAFAPGVSAMNPMGWSPTLAEQWVRAGARQTRLRCFDIMELNPEVDPSGRTPHLAARLLLAFLAEFAAARDLSRSAEAHGS